MENLYLNNLLELLKILTSKLEDTRYIIYYNQIPFGKVLALSIITQYQYWKLLIRIFGYVLWVLT